MKNKLFFQVVEDAIEKQDSSNCRGDRRSGEYKGQVKAVIERRSQSPHQLRHRSL